MASNTGGQVTSSGSTGQGDEEVDNKPGPSAETTDRVEKLGDDVDALLDEIDEVLEENAEEFVKAYVQKGGQ